MAGWEISVTTQTLEERERFLDQGTILASWTTGAMGINPFEDLLEAGNAVLLRSDGYPRIYTAEARYILPVVRAVPEQAAAAIMKAWYVTMRLPMIEVCDLDRRLTIIAWDQS